MEDLACATLPPVELHLALGTCHELGATLVHIFSRYLLSVQDLGVLISASSQKYHSDCRMMRCGCAFRVVNWSAGSDRQMSEVLD